MLIGLDDVVHALRRGEFKLNCSITWIAYLVQHGIVNIENNSNLVEIYSRLNRKHNILIV